MYNRPRIIPVLLIDDRDLIKTKQFGSPTYLGDPVNAVKIFNRKGIDEMANLSVAAKKGGQTLDWKRHENRESEAFMRLSYGGGITTVEHVMRLLATGDEKVVINTSFVRKPELVTEAVNLAGGQGVVVSIDAKKVDGRYKCVISDGQEVIDSTPVELAQKAEAMGAGEIFLNSVDRDGMMQGYDLDLVKSVADAVNIPVTACGGAAGINDLERVLHEGKAHAAAAGSMFVFYGRLKAVLITAPTEEELRNLRIYN